MEHQIQHTQAVVLKVINIEESSKLLYLFTKKFGLIHAKGQALREERSKLRSHLNLFSLVGVDLVHGKSLWKITGAAEETSVFSFSETFFSFMDRFSKLILRLCQGEEAEDKIWKDLVSLFSIFPHTDKRFLPALEILIVVRLLSHLGYWGGSTQDFLLSDFPFQEKYYEDILKRRIFFVSLVNQSLEQTQL